MVVPPARTMQVRVEPDAQGEDRREADSPHQRVGRAKERQRQRTEEYGVQHVRGRHGRH